MDLHLHGLDREVELPAGHEVEIGRRRGSDVREQPRTTVWLVGAMHPDRGPVDLELGGRGPKDVAGATVWRLGVNRYRGRCKQGNGTGTGFGAARTEYRTAPGRSDDPGFDDDNRPAPLANPRVGDRVLVTLHLTATEAAEWVAIEDPIPAAFEVVKPYYEPPAKTPGAPVQRSWYGDFQEVRGDSIRFFRNDLPADEYVIRYVVRIRSAGSILAPPARVEAMYQPQRFAQTTVSRLRIQARE